MISRIRGAISVARSMGHTVVVKEALRRLFGWEYSWRGIAVKDTEIFRRLHWLSQYGEVWGVGDVVCFRNKWYTLAVPITHIHMLYIEVINSDFFEHTYGFLNVRGRVVADVGAFIGETAIYFSKRGAKLVHAYEPVFYRFIAKNLEVNGVTNVVVHPYGLWTEADKFRVTLAGAGTGLMPGDVEVEVRPMAEAITDVVKLDCEGCEWALIALPCDVIKRAEEYAIEIHGPPMPIVHKMEKCGYKARHVMNIDQLIDVYYFKQY